MSLILGWNWKAPCCTVILPKTVLNAYCLYCKTENNDHFMVLVCGIVNWRETQFIILLWKEIYCKFLFSAFFGVLQLKLHFGFKYADHHITYSVYIVSLWHTFASLPVSWEPLGNIGFLFYIFLMHFLPLKAVFSGLDSQISHFCCLFLHIFLSQLTLRYTVAPIHI